MNPKMRPLGGSKSLKNDGGYANFNNLPLLFAGKKKHRKKSSCAATWPPRDAPGLPIRLQKGPNRAPKVERW